MSTSPYFNNTSHPGQQKLTEDLIVEAIQLRGVNAHYVPRETIDDIAMFNEAEKNKFAVAKDIELYVESITNFNGQGDLFAKFGGFTFEDRATLVYSSKRFKEEMVGLRTEPKPGDLIYIDFADVLFEVQKRLEDEDWKQWGRNYVYRLEVSKYKYGHEEFDTGIDGIDDVVGSYEFEELDDMLQPTGIIGTNDPRDVREEVLQTPEGSSQIKEFGR